MGYASPANPSLEKEQEELKMNNQTYFLHNKNDTSWIGSIAAAGAMVGGLIGAPLASMYGRKTALLFNCLPFILGWSLILFANTTWMIISGRLLTGMAGGFASGVVSIYSMEISPIHMRGAVGFCFALMGSVGYALASILGIFLEWRMLAMACGIPSVIMPFLMIFAPETPVYMMSKYGYSKKTITTLQKLRRGENVTSELNEISTQAQNKAPLIVSSEQLTSPIVYKPLLLLMALFLFQQLSGPTAVGFYQTEIFKKSGSSLNPRVCNGIASIPPLITGIISSLLIDKCGRKMLLYTSGVGIISSLSLLSFFFWNNSNASFVQNYGWLALVSLIGFQGFLNFGFNSIPWVLVAEMTPYFAKGFISSICTCFAWFFAFFISKIFNDMVDLLTPHGAYLFFAIMTLVGVLFVKFLIPETNRKTTEEILAHFIGKKVPEDRKLSVFVSNLEP
ncbi:hypothetical protein B4U79_10680 [Dinothrombium tinctorium]|uniref:Major facilitator superfamily (MFS) profile domain-containing protein n=1 Tax=Dinothrombium tinctorium TaxID=1965070 RepID=A0A443RMI0_9ACAR|nr:hypothetical protein B4U79_10680 [Dinothrombium tinctorium]